jgi:SAM-dependent methyltransferase
MDRLREVRQHVDIGNLRGLEVGPLVSPIVTRDIGSVHYADHASTEELRVKYAPDPNVDIERIPDVDFVWGELTLAESAAAEAPFDYVVASHVLEHVPDLIGWLHEIAEVLRPGGRVCLVIPDRRVTFDVRRRPSDMAELVEAHLLRLRRPALRATFDHFSNYIPVDTGALWNGVQAYPANSPINLTMGWEYAVRAARTDEYIDTHCWVFSDAEFVALMGDLMRMGLLDFRFAGFTPTQVGDFEFFAVLERLDDAMSPADRLERSLGSLPGTGTLTRFPLRTPDPSAALAEVLSARESAVILGKRRAMAKARRLLGRFR